MNRSADRRLQGAGLASWAHVLPLVTIALAAGMFYLLASNPAQAPSPPQAPAAQTTQANPATPAPNPSSPVIRLAADGEIQFAGETMIEEILQLHLLDLAGKGTREIQIQPDPQTPSERVAQIEQFCRSAGIPKINTLPAAKPGP